MPKSATAPEAPAPIAKPEPKLPDWVTKTPNVGYKLIVFDCGGDEAQGVYINRAEYIALKRRLCELRGIPPSAVVDGDEEDEEAA